MKHDSAGSRSARSPAFPAAGWLVLGLVWLAGCGGAEPLEFYCGAGIRPPVAELAERFAARTGIEVACDYAGSELLLGRIKLSGRGDLYMPGDEQYLDQAEQAGLIASKETVCYFVPVIIVRKGNPKGIRSLDDLARPGIKLGLGDPEACAIGVTTARIFAKNGMDPETIEPNVAFRALTVNELGNHVKLGSLDAAIVWDAVAAYFAEEADAVPIPPEQNVISTVAVAVLKSSTRPELARQFVEFMTSDEGRAVFGKHHYTLEPP
jgi:molybdate transport system substrate-binding protein